MMDKQTFEHELQMLLSDGLKDDPLRFAILQIWIKG